ncbi:MULTISPECIES: hypothetical protein [Sphingobacterium]|uniref:hypothetical protein n=1 Tax=Sphingobacterium TaxID=28453 RepID=UPI00257A0446|nr:MULTISPECIES: hypothetical protein [Sphingobacterium]
MAKRIIDKNFSRWIPNEKSTWVFQVFQKYNDELEKDLWSYQPVTKRIYKNLKQDNANWADSVENHFEFDDKKEEVFKNLKDWSNSFNHFDNWVNLNIVMSISANFETYLASVVSLALKSNPAILFGASKMIDGISLLKHGTTTKLDFESQIIACTKGDWSSRTSAFEKIFGNCPDILTRKIGQLEQVRKLRNKVGHSFGRDIDEAREHIFKKILPAENISREKTYQYQKLLWSTAKSIDIYLLENHIGTFQAISFYHSEYQKMRKDVHQSIRAVDFKKIVGRTGVQSASKQFYKDLVKYYESL